MDTTTIIHLLFEKEHGNKGDYLTKGKVVEKREEIWKNFFRIEKKKIFGNKDTSYKFNYQVHTDGIGASILKIRSDLYNINGKSVVHSIRKPKGFKQERYIDELTEAEKEKYNKFDIVGIDPNLSDLIYSTNGKTKNVKGKHKTTTFRYTQDQRRKETKVKKYMKIIDSLKKDTKIKNASVKELEAILSKFDSKSCSYTNNCSYIKTKNKINSILYSFYEKSLFRKLKLNGYINRQKSESKMINSFRTTYGNPSKVLVAFGDFEQRQHMKYKEPVKGKGMRKIFSKAGYTIFLVDEYNTSCKCYFNGVDMEKFRKRGNPRPWKDNITTYHGLLRSKNVPNDKSNMIYIMNRDFNASMNIRYKAFCYINNKELPSYLTRKK